MFSAMLTRMDLMDDVLGVVIYLTPIPVATGHFRIPLGAVLMRKLNIRQFATLVHFVVSAITIGQLAVRDRLPTASASADGSSCFAHALRIRYIGQWAINSLEQYAYSFPH